MCKVAADSALRPDGAFTRTLDVCVVQRAVYCHVAIAEKMVKIGYFWNSDMAIVTSALSYLIFV